MNNYNKHLTKYSQNLRKEMTPQERHLWYDFLKELPIVIKRQKVIENYIVDFYCPSMKMAIEIDGSQHFEKTGIAEDKMRDKILNDIGIKVLRYSNHEINTAFDSVCEDILKNFEML